MLPSFQLTASYWHKNESFEHAPTIEQFRSIPISTTLRVACSLCGAVHSHALGLGGGFFMTIYIKSEKKSYFLNAREMAPLAANRTMYKNKPKASTEGPLSIAVPGEIKGYFEAKRNPTLTMLDLFEPTINLCNQGFKITHSMKQAIDQFDTNLAKYDPLLW